MEKKVEHKVALSGNCPLRGSNKDGDICNITKNPCPFDSWPPDCPLLDVMVTVEREKT